MNVIRASILLLTVVNLGRAAVISPEKENHVATLHVPDKDTFDLDHVDAEALIEPDNPGVGPVDQNLGTRAGGNSNNSFTDKLVRTFSWKNWRYRLTKSRSSASNQAPPSTTSHDPQRLTAQNKGSATPQPRSKNKGRIPGVLGGGKSKPARGGMDDLNRNTPDSQSDSDSSSDGDTGNNKAKRKYSRRNKPVGKLDYNPNRGAFGNR